MKLINASLIIVCLLVLQFVYGCRGTQSNKASELNMENPNIQNSQIVTKRESPKLCAALRGNGISIMTHFTALARVSELYGLPDGLAGGSSGSISAFLYESIYANPLLRSCSGTNCDGQRGALLLKSVRGYVDLVKDKSNVLALLTSDELSRNIEANEIETLFKRNPEAAAVKLLDMFTKSSYLDLIHPNVFKILKEKDQKKLALGVRQLIEAALALGKFDGTDPAILYRNGILNFEVFADKLTTIADFFAGYNYTTEDEHNMGSFLDQCATISAQNRTWSEIKSYQLSKTSKSQSCGDLFNVAFRTYDEKQKSSGATHRSIDKVGKHLPILIENGVIIGRENVNKFRGAFSHYQNTLEARTDLPFSAIKAGYWGRKSDLDTVAENKMGYIDAKSSKFFSLGEDNWRSVLSYSPAEPGLMPLQIMSEDLVSTGGWIDLAPTLVLKNLGCENVIYLSRRSEVESKFGVALVNHFNISSEDRIKHFHLTDQSSSYALSIAESDAIWCSDFDGFGISELDEMADESYCSEIATKSQFFLNGIPGSQKILSENIAGCVPGATQPVKRVTTVCGRPRKIDSP